MSCYLNEFGRALKETLIRYSEVNITCLNNYSAGVCVCVCVCVGLFVYVNVCRTCLYMLTVTEIDTSHYMHNSF